MRYIRAANPTDVRSRTIGTDWRESAACRGDQLDLFYDGPESEARKVCRSCPIATRRACLDYALTHEKWGVWGGFNPEEREKEKRRRQRGQKPRYSPKKAAPSTPQGRQVPPDESIRLLTEMTVAGHKVMDIAKQAGVSQRILTRLRAPVPPRSVRSQTEDRLRVAHAALLGQEVAA